MDDDDAPPELVDVTAFPESQENKEEEKENQTEEEVVSRVPITLVTGRRAPPWLFPDTPFANVSRISGSRKNNITELHSHRETRQENCCDHEWCVLPVLQTIEYVSNYCTEFGDCKPYLSLLQHPHASHSLII